MNIDEAIVFMSLPGRKITRIEWMKDLRTLKWLESFTISPKYPSTVGLIKGSTTEYYTVGCSYQDYRPGAGPTNFFDMVSSSGGMQPFSINSIPEQISPANNYYQENIEATDYIELTDDMLDEWKKSAKELVRYNPTPTGAWG